jgi:hypothetical protein
MGGLASKVCAEYGSGQNRVSLTYLYFQSACSCDSIYA